MILSADESNDKDTESQDQTMDEPEQESEQAPADLNSELQAMLDAEKQKTQSLEDKLKHTMADYTNLERKTQTDIQNGINHGIDKFLVDFLVIYDDFVRAKSVAAENQLVTDGLESILKNMDALLAKYDVAPIESLGEIFDPNYHEAISIKEDPSLDDSTITTEIRKGYISHGKVIRVALVEISKKPN